MPMKQTKKNTPEPGCRSFARVIDGAQYTVMVVWNREGRSTARCRVGEKEVIGAGPSPERALADWSAKAGAISSHGISTKPESS